MALEMPDPPPYRPTCPVCGDAPVTAHEWARDTLHTDTYTCARGHIWQTRWSAAS